MDFLFWSGGKDAYLALEFYRRNHPAAVIRLLTTFEKKTGYIPHQNIPVDNIKKQATALNLDLDLIPLPQYCPNDMYMEKLAHFLDGETEKIEHLIFGDWYLQDIRVWREEQFSKIGYSCVFPIWEKELHELLPFLFSKQVEVKISAVKNEYKKLISAGEMYNQGFVQQLPDEIDPMGEKGEFHTKVIFE